ncbi:hypothetical protein F7984_10860 [Pradoshia sp. D12]|uniref:hypothetical protein n=1 Tax=Bacillaceae TaxID=186817 RepID=UPI00080AF2AD|nr:MULTISPECIES: hypothetical protein [Bacillaceae]OCA83452.1 hypothetical protein A8L44_11475 [Bacillus sp. FJAT-27986]QFK71694.1 hypothetical protein F7984_10860 [Pradoshia sp. D12]TPF73489.1 hypothetical protein FHY44_07260 [Bacillus sp. D12]
MGKRNKPKFAIGNSVVILVNGIVGKVKSVQEFNQTYVYEVQGADGVFTESSLMLVEDFEGLLFEAEHVNIDYKYFFGDLVQVKGYGKEIFKVIGFRTEIWRYKEESWEDIIYELSRITDNEWLECNEDDLIFLADAKDAEQFLKKHALNQKLKSNQYKKLTEPSPLAHLNKNGNQESDHQEKINHLLDIYNDYRILRDMFGDETYGKVMKTAIKKLEKLVADQTTREKKEPH